MKCFECSNTKFKRQAEEIVTDVGPCRVVDHRHEFDVCTKCGSFAIDYEVGRDIELHAAHMALIGCDSFSGEILKFARKALGLTQRELGERLGRAPETISRNERSPELDGELRFALVGLVAAAMNPDGFDGVELKRAG